MKVLKIITEVISGRNFIKEIDEANTRIDTLENQIKDFNVRLDEEKSKYDSEKAAHEVTKRELSIEKSQHTDTKRDLDRTKETVSETERVCNNDCQTYQREILRLQRSCTNKERQISTLRSEKQELKEEVARQSEIIKNHESKIDSLSEQLNNASSTKTIHEFESKIGELKGTISRKESELEEKTRKIDELKEQLTTEKDKYTSEKKSHSSTKGKLTLEKKNHSETKKKLDTEIETHKKTQRLLLEDRVKHQNDIKKLEVERYNLQIEKQRLNSELDKKTESIRELNNKLISSNKELTRMQAQLNLIQQELDKSNNSIALKESELESIHEKVQSKKDELYEANKKIDLLTNQLNNLSCSEEISRLEKQIQDLQERISESNSEIESKNHKIDEAERTRSELISQLNSVRHEKEDLNSSIQTLKNQIKALEEDNRKLTNQITDLETTKKIESGLEEPTMFLLQRGLPNPDKSNAQISTIRRRSKVKDELNVLDLKSARADFPIFMNGDNDVNRSIKYVYDEHGEVIDADKFFSNNDEEIVRIGRLLAGADIVEEVLWTCGCCRNPVKIARNTTNGKESLFFMHAKHNLNCDWSKITTAPSTHRISMVEDTPLETTTPKSKEIKEFLYDILTSDTSQDAGINDVKKDSIISSNLPYLKWRRPDISFIYNGKQIVLQLLKPRENLTSIVDLDIFCYLNNIQIIWMFIGENTDMYGINFKDSLFDNHRNVFVFDDDVNKKCTELNTLVLKCNWLLPDNTWAITLKNNGTNGKMISLSDLNFDEEYCKPYHFDANEPYFNLHPEEQQKYEDSRKSREELLSELETKWTRDENYLHSQATMRKNNECAILFEKNGFWGFKYKDTVLIQPIFSTKPRKIVNDNFVVNQDGNLGLIDCYGRKIVSWDGRFKCDDIAFDQINNRVLIKENNLWGVADIHGNTLISPLYNAIETWSANSYRVKNNGRWGICDINGKLLSDCIYERINDLNNGKALTSIVFNGEWQPRHGYIDENGKQQPTTRVHFTENIRKEQWFGLWGLYSENDQCLLHPEYDDISSWHENSFRICRKGKWGVINIDTKQNIIPEKYDSIGDVVNGVSIAKSGNAEYSFDLNGNEVPDRIIELRDGFKKIKKSGKWGIIAPDGSEIIKPLYDEIGSFRCRLVGIINGQIIKLNVIYNFPIYISAKYLKSVETSYIFNIAGVKMSIAKSMFNANGQTLSVLDSAKMYHRFAFGNILFSEQRCCLRILKEANLVRPLSHGDSDSTFELNEIVEVTITELKRYRRYGTLTTSKLIARTDDGRITMIPSRFFRVAGMNINDYAINDKIKLRKTGFDDGLDQTLWEIVKK